MLDKRTILTVDELEVVLETGAGELKAVRGTSFDLREGEAIGIVGESGSGKSMTALALMRLLPRVAKMRANALVLDGIDIKATNDRIFANSIAGQKISMIFQEPMTSLNPVYTIGRQMTEAAIHFAGLSLIQARTRAIALLDRVGIPEPAERLQYYPHQLSGGQRQRVMIAMALMNEPKLIIADEPTTALDVTVQAQIMELLSELRREFGMAMILITHDLAVVASAVDKVAVMYGGEIVEKGPCKEVLNNPKHPYTRGLLACVPQMGDVPRRLGAIPGIVPNLPGDIDYCAFSSRCTLVQDICRTQRPPLQEEAGRSYSCILAPAQIDALLPSKAKEELLVSVPETNSVLIEAKNIRKVYYHKTSLFGPKKTVQAVKDVSLQIKRGETFALVGESGSGKTTLAKILLGLNTADSGAVFLDGKAVAKVDGRKRARLMQPIFQDPYSSLNPRHTIADIISRPLEVHGIGDEKTRKNSVAEVMERVGLPQRVLNNYPSQMSGGQRQRVAIARALITKPALLICDEPTSALDVSVQAQILNLLVDLQRDLGLAYLIITHNIAVVHQIAAKIAVMHHGEIIEMGGAQEILRAPKHPYTKLLLSAVPELDVSSTAQQLAASTSGDNLERR